MEEFLEESTEQAEVLAETLDSSSRGQGASEPTRSQLESAGLSFVEGETQAVGTDPTTKEVLTGEEVSTESSGPTTANLAAAESQDATPRDQKRPGSKSPFIIGPTGNIGLKFPRTMSTGKSGTRFLGEGSKLSSSSKERPGLPAHRPGQFVTLYRSSYYRSVSTIINRNRWASCIIIISDFIHGTWWSSQGWWSTPFVSHLFIIGWCFISSSLDDQWQSILKFCWWYKAKGT